MNRKKWFALAIVLALLSAPACSLGGLLEGLGLSEEPGTMGRNAVESPPVRPLATLYPTATPRPRPATVTPPAPTVGPATVAPPEDERSFVLELTEAELAALVGDDGLAQQGLQVNDLVVVITEEHVIATFNAAHADSGLSGEITMVGVPQVVDGEVYLRIVDFSLGTGFSGFAKLIASALIQTAIDNYNTENGIPIPVSGAAEITAVELFSGRLVISGVYR
jgi:hypothetical protein